MYRTPAVVAVERLKLGPGRNLIAAMGKIDRYALGIFPGGLLGASFASDLDLERNFAVRSFDDPNVAVFVFDGKNGRRKLRLPAR